MSYVPLPPPKVIKSILKKKKNLPADKDHNSILRQIVHNSPVDTHVEIEKQDKSNANNKLQNTNAHSNKNISNGHVKRVHLDNKQDICINDTNLQNEHEGFKEHLQNGVPFKPNGNLQTVQVDIH